jgi:toxin FitB
LLRCARNDEPLSDLKNFALTLDTNLISETGKLRADAGVIAFLAAADNAGLFLSVLTLGELRKGVEARRRIDVATAARLEAWVDDIEATFADRVLPVDVAAARLWASYPPAAACR